MNNYFFFDGSALLADIRKIHQCDPFLDGKPLHLDRVMTAFQGSWRHFHQGSFRRAVFYFVEGDDRVERLIKAPDTRRSGAITDLQVKYCGKRVRQTEKAAQWLEENQAPQYVLDSLHRAEKAVDTQICCDALQLAGQGKLDRLFLYTNDSDFVPLLQALRQLGANANLIRLNDDNVNKELADECDGLCALAVHELDHSFAAQNRPT